MARPLRIEYPDAVYHITARGNEKKTVFRKARDRELFLDTLNHVNDRYNWICHAYCLMDNHYHLLIETPDGNLSQGMRQLNGVYTQSFNKRYHRSGHLFQGRYRAILIQKDSHLLEVSRYVVLNPVRAGIVKNPEDWAASSYRATTGIENPHFCLTTDWILAQFGTKRSGATKQYRRFVLEGIGKESIWSDVKGQILLGKEDFLNEFIGYVKGYEDIREIPKSQRLLNRPALRTLFTEEIVRDKRKRNQTIKKAFGEYGYTQKEIARHIGLHDTSVSRLIAHSREC
jgi:REP element-mobilizing transposase RayT